MFSIFLKTIKEKKWQILLYSLFGAVFLWMYIALFPTVQKSSADVSGLIKNLPEGLNKAFSLDAQSFTTFEGLVAGKEFSLVWPIMLIGLAVSFGSSFFSGEIEKGTIDILLSEPISRTKIFLSKMLAGIFGIFVFVIISVLSVFPLAYIYNLSFNGENFFKLSLVGFTFGLALLGLSALFSAIFSEKGKAAFSISGILIVVYFLNIISLLKDSLDKIKYFSIFYYFNYSDLLIHGRIDPWSFWVFLSIFLLSSFLGLIWFNKRDISV